VSRRRGRKPLDSSDPSVPLTVRFSVREFDAICKKARQLRCTVPELVRRQLRREPDERARRDDDDERR
jgi:hypothetical protein